MELLKLEETLEKTFLNLYSNEETEVNAFGQGHC